MSSKTRDLIFWILLALLPGVLLLVIIVILPSMSFFRARTLYDSDINWLLKTGEYIYDSGFKLPGTDIYSFTHTETPWILYQWLYELILYLFYSLAGFSGMGLLSTITIGLTFTILFINLRLQRIYTFYISIAIIAGLWITTINWYARPASMTYLFTALLLLLFTLAEKKSSGFI
jgi:hypothetical protein